MRITFWQYLVDRGDKTRATCIFLLPNGAHKVRTLLRGRGPNGSPPSAGQCDARSHYGRSHSWALQGPDTSHGCDLTSERRAGNKRVIDPSGWCLVIGILEDKWLGNVTNPPRILQHVPWPFRYMQKMFLQHPTPRPPIANHNV